MLDRRRPARPDRSSRVSTTSAPRPSGSDPANRATDRSVSRRPAGASRPSSPDARGDRRVQLGFVRGRRGDQRGLGEPVRQPQRDLAAPVPDRHLGHLAAQLRQPPRPRRDGVRAIGPAEVRRGTEQPGSDQTGQFVQVGQPVLHRRRGQQQQVSGREFPGEPARGRPRVPQPMSLVHDDQVPRRAHQRRLGRIPAGGGQGGDHHRRFVGLLPVAAPRNGRRQAELAFQLLPPLVDQPGRGDHEDPARQPAQPQLGQHQSRLDGLAQPDLVGQDRPAAHPAQHGGHGLQLVVERLEGQGRPRHQGVEPGPAPHRRGGVDQVDPLRADPGAAEQPLEEVPVPVGCRRRRVGRRSARLPSIVRPGGQRRLSINSAVASTSRPPLGDEPHHTIRPPTAPWIRTDDQRGVRHVDPMSHSSPSSTGRGVQAAAFWPRVFTVGALTDRP